MKKKFLLISAVLGAGVLAYSCGGGGGTTVSDNTGAGGTVTIASYITDAPASQFPVFEATLYSIKLCNDTGCQTIFSDQNGMTVDLTELRGVMRYLGTSQIPAGTYSRVEIEVSSTVNAVDNNGTPYTLSFTNIQNQQISVSCTQDRCTISINAQVDTSTGSIAIDFELDRFQVDTNTGQITDIAVSPMDPGQQQNQTGMQYMTEIAGTVQSVGENSISVDVAGQTFTLNIDQNTICKYMASCADIQQGWCIEAEVLGNPAQQTSLTAIKIERESSKGCIGEFEMEDDYEDMNYRELKFYVNAGDISVAEGTLNVNGQEFSITDSTVCKFEVPSNMLQSPSQNVSSQSPSEMYMMGPACSENLSTLLENMQGTNQMLEVEVEVDNGNNVIELEVSMEYENNYEKDDD